MIESKLDGEIVINGIIGKYFCNRHVLLIYLRSKEEIGNSPTVIDIIKAFKITKKYAWLLLEKLEEENLVKKGEKVVLNRKEYYSYLPTNTAKQDLRILSLCLNKNRIYCQNPKSSECPYSDETDLEMSLEKKVIVKNGV